MVVPVVNDNNDQGLFSGSSLHHQILIKSPPCEPMKTPSAGRNLNTSLPDTSANATWNTSFLQQIMGIPTDYQRGTSESFRMLSSRQSESPSRSKTGFQRSTLDTRGAGKMTSLGASPKCHVCSHKPNEARVVTFCGHLFCWPCLCCWLHNKSPNKECPVCNSPLTKDHITPLHGRQNSLTVARLQGMLRTDKTPSRSNPAGGRRCKNTSTATSSQPKKKDITSNAQNEIVQHHVQCFDMATPQLYLEQPGTITTASTVVTTNREIPETQIQEDLRKLGVLVSMEWEGAMSVIENAWLDAVSDVLSRPTSSFDQESAQQQQHLMQFVERLSKEKESIVQELASMEPFFCSSWLPGRLESFKRIVNEELNRFNILPEVVNEDWFMEFRGDDREPVFFPELNSPVEDEEEVSEWIAAVGSSFKKRKIDDEHVSPYSPNSEVS